MIELTTSDRTFIGEVSDRRQCYMSADTLIEMRRRIDEYNLMHEPSGATDPMVADLRTGFGIGAIRIEVRAGLAFGTVEGPNSSSMSLDTLVPLMTPAHRGPFRHG